jgi:hypothetical protein
MLNNAIDHSRSPAIDVEVSVKKNTLIFNVVDSGIGIFRNVMAKKKLRTQEDAARELLKGKVTTQPRAHSGQGIFFSSKNSDLFIIDSLGVRLVIDTLKKDVRIVKSSSRKKGTTIRFIISTLSKRHLSEAFDKYDVKDNDLDEFNKTDVQVNLYSKGILVSRSQARKMLSNLEKFRIVVLNYDKIPLIGQAFADEIYRVFKNKYPDIVIHSVNTTPGVKHMIDRAQGKINSTQQGTLL